MAPGRAVSLSRRRPATALGDRRAGRRSLRDWFIALCGDFLTVPHPLPLTIRASPVNSTLPFVT